MSGFDPERCQCGGGGGKWGKGRGMIKQHDRPSSNRKSYSRRRLFNKYGARAKGHGTKENLRGGQRAILSGAEIGQLARVDYLKIDGSDDPRLETENPNSRNPKKPE